MCVCAPCVIEAARGGVDGILKLLFTQVALETMRAREDSASTYRPIDDCVDKVVLCNMALLL